MRYYDPAIGRWTQEDSHPGPNLYWYAADDPIDKVDPSGASCNWLMAVAGIATIVVPDIFIGAALVSSLAAGPEATALLVTAIANPAIDWPIATEGMLVILPEGSAGC
jgi:hypothetical protein